MERRAAQAEREPHPSQTVDATCDENRGNISGGNHRRREVRHLLPLREIPGGWLCPCQQSGHGERLDYDRATYTMTARQSGRAFRMGDRVQVRIALIDPDERTLHWELVESGKPGSTSTKRSHKSENLASPVPSRTLHKDPHRPKEEEGRRCSKSSTQEEVSSSIKTKIEETTTRRNLI